MAMCLGDGLLRTHSSALLWQLGAGTGWGRVNPSLRGWFMPSDWLIRDVHVWHPCLISNNSDQVMPIPDLTVEQVKSHGGSAPTSSNTYFSSYLTGVPPKITTPPPVKPIHTLLLLWVLLEESNLRHQKYHQGNRLFKKPFKKCLHTLTTCVLKLPKYHVKCNLNSSCTKISTRKFGTFHVQSSLEVGNMPGHVVIIYLWNIYSSYILCPTIQVLVIWDERQNIYI